MDVTAVAYMTRRGPSSMPEYLGHGTSLAIGQHNLVHRLFEPVKSFVPLTRSQLSDKVRSDRNGDYQKRRGKDSTSSVMKKCEARRLLKDNHIIYTLT